MIISSYQNIMSPDAVNSGGHAVDTLTGLLIDIANRIEIDLYIKN